MTPFPVVGCHEFPDGISPNPNLCEEKQELRHEHRSRSGIKIPFSKEQTIKRGRLEATICMKDWPDLGWVHGHKPDHRLRAEGELQNG